MMKKALARVMSLVSNNTEQAEAPALCVHRERELSEEWLFQGTDERGCKGWFLRIEVTGMYPRRCGPFETQEDALEFLEAFLSDVATDPFCELDNRVRTPQLCMVEGIPRLAATTNGAGCSR